MAVFKSVILLINISTQSLLLLLFSLSYAFGFFFGLFIFSHMNYCPVTCLCVSLCSSEDQDRMGRQDTVHNKIKRRRSQIWHQWYDGCALSIVKSVFIGLLSSFRWGTPYVNVFSCKQVLYFETQHLSFCKFFFFKQSKYFWD